MIDHLNDTSFDKTLATIPYALVDFYAPWCQPCKALSPLLDRAAETIPGLTVLKVDIEQAPKTALTFRVQGVPTLLLMKQGKVVAQRTGALTFAALVQWIESNR